MTALQLFKMLALFLVGLVLVTSASPIAMPTSNVVSAAATSCYSCMVTFGKKCQFTKLSAQQCRSLWCYSEQCQSCLKDLSCPNEQAVGADLAVDLTVAPPTDVAITIPSDVSIAIPSGISDETSSEASADINCYRCVYIDLFCKRIGLSEDQCFTLRCKDADCYRCGLSCREIHQVDGSDPAPVNSVVAESSPTSVAEAVKREEAKHCFWVCVHTYCTHQCIGDDSVVAYKASGALVIGEADVKANSTISVSANHAQLQNPFLYHCDWTSGVCWMDPIREAVAGTDISIEDIPDIPTKVCHEVCNMDESLCGLICNVDENSDDKKNDLAYHQSKCHWECMYGQCWTVCPPTMAAGSADVASASLKCRWECYFGQCHACCIPSAKGDAVEKRGTPPPPCHQRCDDEKCWIVCPRPPVE